ncbi:hypothetical protein PCLA_05f0346 [Pseudomonas citronellolis]|nr:hypothetical protein PCLA_05f0346 [Pseudomonas citronellolis]
MDGYKTLKAGQPVSFEILQGPKGLHAVNIQPIGASAPASTAQASPSSEVQSVTAEA